MKVPVDCGRLMKLFVGSQRHRDVTRVAVQRHSVCTEIHTCPWIIGEAGILAAEMHSIFFTSKVDDRRQYTVIYRLLSPPSNQNFLEIGFVALQRRGALTTYPSKLSLQNFSVLPWSCPPSTPMPCTPTSAYFLRVSPDAENAKDRRAYGDLLLERLTYLLT